MTPTDEMIQKIVVARLLTMPDNIGISIGGDGKFSKNEMIDHVKKNDEIGKKIIEIQLAYLQSLKELTNELVNDQYGPRHSA